MSNFDYRLEHDLNRYAGHHHLADVFAKRVAESQLEVAVALLLILVFGLAARRNRLVVASLAAVAAAGVALLGNVIVSSLWYRPRPFVTHPKAVHLLVHHPADASFPSDHAAALAGITIVLLAFVWQLGLVALFWSLLVGAARVYVGEHFPGDIIAGYALGAIAAVIVIALLRSDVAKALVARLPRRVRERLVLTNPATPG